MRILECLAEPSFCFPEVTKTDVALWITTIALGYIILTQGPRWFRRTPLQGRATYGRV